ncbi:MmcQ/YjbR family DNA-binding protein [Antribacter gilvus]|uniref:MmcQ/YjbR family DNA-binding protein n=1 Tax=Antribacter gilvus TaxID=2304675 RepID=UPI000F783BE2|nr:MmcQ/YjbR family DNA-binding protein [Antribacter gilvus]
MATFDDVRRLALALPEVTEKVSWGSPMWCVRDKGFVWDRPLRTKDRAELGAAAPVGAILGVRVADEGEKQALIAANPDVFFTVSHLDGYPAVLLLLDAISPEELEELVVDAWLDRAPKRLRDDYLAARGPGAE